MKIQIVQPFFRALSLSLVFGVLGGTVIFSEGAKAFVPLSESEVDAAFQTIHPAPRLLMTDETIAEVRQKIDANPVYAAYYEALLRKGERLRTEEPLKRVLTGIRLLGVSRQAVDRLLTWSFLYRMTGDTEWARRVETEACAIAAFENWHPDHFLDVAEMTLAMAIAFDSCQETFAPENREMILEAIRDKGVRTAIEHEYWWQKNDANWNQVCWCGALYGALAIADEEPELAKKTVRLATEGVSPSMAAYEPDGTYTEGASYWGYGTGFNVLLLAALESAFGTDFGRGDSEGFRSTIFFYENVFGTTGQAFNYSDCGGGAIFEPTVFWFGRLWNLPEITVNENRALSDAYQSLISSEADRKPIDWTVSDRTAVCPLLWGPVQFDPSAVPPSLGFVGVGNGRAPVALFRTGWKETDAFLGIKGGEPRAPHGHMDVGGFVYDDLGVRWFIDLGPESYHKIEQLGMHLWDFGQDSDRWKILRYNNFGHSVPNINGAPQKVDGRCAFTETKIGGPGEESYAQIDLTPAYRDEAASLIRRAVLFPDGSLEITDTLTALPDKPAVVQRRFVTSAGVEIGADGNLILTVPDKANPGASLRKAMLLSGDLPSEVSLIPARTGQEYDSENGGVTLICITAALEPGCTAEMSATLRNLSDDDSKESEE